MVAGTGDHCLPFDEAQCGDGGPATEALLTGPKGTARAVNPDCVVGLFALNVNSVVISSVVVRTWQHPT